MGKAKETKKQQQQAGLDINRKRSENQALRASERLVVSARAEEAVAKARRHLPKCVLALVVNGDGEAGRIKAYALTLARVCRREGQTKMALQLENAAHHMDLGKPLAPQNVVNTSMNDWEETVQALDDDFDQDGALDSVEVDGVGSIAMVKRYADGMISKGDWEKYWRTIGLQNRQLARDATASFLIRAPQLAMSCADPDVKERLHLQNCAKHTEEMITELTKEELIRFLSQGLDTRLVGGLHLDVEEYINAAHILLTLDHQSFPVLEAFWKQKQHVIQMALKKKYQRLYTEMEKKKFYTTTVAPEFEKTKASLQGTTRAEILAASENLMQLRTTVAPAEMNKIFDIVKDRVSKAAERHKGLRDGDCGAVGEVDMTTETLMQLAQEDLDLAKSLLKNCGFSGMGNQDKIDLGGHIDSLSESVLVQQAHLRSEQFVKGLREVHAQVPKINATGDAFIALPKLYMEQLREITKHDLFDFTLHEDHVEEAMDLVNHLVHEVKAGLVPVPREETPALLGGVDAMTIAFESLRFIMRYLKPERFGPDPRVPTLTTLAALEEGMDLRRHHAAMRAKKTLLDKAPAAVRLKKSISSVEECRGNEAEWNLATDGYYPLIQDSREMVTDYVAAQLDLYRNNCNDQAKLVKAAHEEVGLAEDLLNGTEEDMETIRDQLEEQKLNRAETLKKLKDVYLKASTAKEEFGDTFENWATAKTAEDDTTIDEIEKQLGVLGKVVALADVLQHIDSSPPKSKKAWKSLYDDLVDQNLYQDLPSPMREEIDLNKSK